MSLGKTPEQPIGRTFKEIAAKRAGEIGRDQFGDETLVRVAGGFKKEKKDYEPSQDIWGNHYLLDDLKDTLVEWDKAEQERFRQYRHESDRLASAMWKSDESGASSNPSIWAICNRRDGYSLQGIEKPLPDPPESILVRMIGTGAHYEFGRFLKRIRHINVEQRTPYMENPDLSGRQDALVYNRRIRAHQLIEMKFVSSFAFRKVSRAGLPDYLKANPKNYQPGAENERQVVLYMYADTHGNPPIPDMASTLIIYFNRDNGQTKQALVPWDPVHQYDAEQMIEQMRKDQQLLKEGQLPTPNVLHEYMCKICPFRNVCEFGQPYAAEKERQARKRRSYAVYILQREYAMHQAQKLAETGMYQPTALSPDDLDVLHKPTGRSLYVVPKNA